MNTDSTYALSRRAFLATSGGLALATLMPGWPADAGSIRHFSLKAAPGRVPLVGGKYPDTAVWAYNCALPGPEIRARQGERLGVVVENGLGEETTAHWHGMRVPNPMDGVPDLTQKPIAPGQTFVYEFVCLDAGTFWYHPHQRSYEQVGRGLYCRELCPLVAANLAAFHDNVVQQSDLKGHVVFVFFNVAPADAGPTEMRAFLKQYGWNPDDPAVQFLTGSPGEIERVVQRGYHIAYYRTQGEDAEGESSTIRIENAVADRAKPEFDVKHADTIEVVDGAGRIRKIFPTARGSTICFCNRPSHRFCPTLLPRTVEGATDPWRILVFKCGADFSRTGAMTAFGVPSPE